MDSLSTVIVNEIPATIAEQSQQTLTRRHRGPRRQRNHQQEQVQQQPHYFQPTPPVYFDAYYQQQQQEQSQQQQQQHIDANTNRNNGQNPRKHERRRNNRKLAANINNTNADSSTTGVPVANDATSDAPQTQQQEQKSNKQRRPRQPRAPRRDEQNKPDANDANPSANNNNNNRRRNNQRHHQNVTQDTTAVETTNSDDTVASNSSSTRQPKKSNRFATQGAAAGADQQQFSAFSRKTPIATTRSSDEEQDKSDKSKTRQSRPKKRAADILGRGYTELTETIAEKLQSNSYECMICYENIKRQAPIWSCSNCYAVFHLSCIKKWTKSSNPDCVAQQDGSLWRCPGCQYSYTEKIKGYTCFCGSTVDPPFNPYEIAHSCGQVCSKVRKGSPCPHPCNMLCHPGPCPPCSAIRTIKCFCGDLEYTVRCSDAESAVQKSCGKVCNKLLSCGKHRCTQPCHRGECGDCDVEYVHECYCGKTTGIKRKCEPMSKTVVVSETGALKTFSCDVVCNKKLACGNHECQKKCHLGECGECTRLPSLVNTCPCGKTPLKSLKGAVARTSCLDPIATCTKVCGKYLPCGKHKCNRQCHEGPCGHCTDTFITVNCRCGKSTTKIPCFLTYYTPTYQRAKKSSDLDDIDDGGDTNAKATTEADDPVSKELDAIARKYPAYPFVCERVCSTPKSCGRHQCKIKCCPSYNIPYYLDIHGPHYCPRTCGKRLNCGNHDCDMPCGRHECPPCVMTLTEPLSCRCGATSLPPPLQCGTPRPTCFEQCSIPRECGHEQNHQCHWDGDCPPCTTIVEKPCVGSHQNVRVPCCTKKASCGKVCGKLLPVCKHHTCTRFCHDGPCLPNNNKSATTSSSGSGCGQPCGRSLPCGHSCQKPCHPNVAHTASDCVEKVKIFCECKHISKVVNCAQIQRLIKSDKKITQAVLSSLSSKYSLYADAEFSIGIIDLTNIELPPLLPCDFECARIKRNKMLSEALQVSEERINQQPMIHYAAPLVAFAKKSAANLRFVKQIEEVFDDMIKNNKANHLFPHMSTDKRNFIISLANGYYSIQTESLDAKPYTSIQAHRRTHSAIPPVLLSDYIAILHGQQQQQPQSQLTNNNYNNNDKSDAVKASALRNMEDELFGNSDEQEVESLAAGAPKPEANNDNEEDKQHQQRPKQPSPTLAAADDLSKEIEELFMD